jgi:hypothetical protein
VPGIFFLFLLAGKMLAKGERAATEEDQQNDDGDDGSVAHVGVGHGP